MTILSIHLGSRPARHRSQARLQPIGRRAVRVSMHSLKLFESFVAMEKIVVLTSKCGYLTTVDGSEIRLQKPVEVGRLSHYLQGFIHTRWLFGISEESTVVPLPTFFWRLTTESIAGFHDVICEGFLRVPLLISDDQWVLLPFMAKLSTPPKMHRETCWSNQQSDLGRPFGLKLKLDSEREQKANHPDARCK